MPTPDGSPIIFNAAIIDADVPLLIGLDAMVQHGLDLMYSKLLLTSGLEEWTLPLIIVNGQSFIQPTMHELESLFTKHELERMHLHFFHPSTSKLYNLIRRASPEKADNNLRKMLEDIRNNCQTCQEFHSPPFRFRARIPESEIAFNQELAIDLLWLEGKPALHVIDTQTAFSNAKFINNKTADGLWQLFVDIWATVYTGYPSVIRLDRETSFDSKIFRRHAARAGITLQFSGIEIHNAIAVGERYHAPLRKIFLTIRSEHTKIESDVALRLGIKALNDTMGPNGLVPSLLVFGVLPTWPAPLKHNPRQTDRFKAMNTARREMESFVAQQRIRRGNAVSLCGICSYSRSHYCMM